MFSIISTLIQLGSSFGVGQIVGNVVKATTPDNLKTFGKICTGLGSLVLTGVLSDLCSDYIEKQVTDVQEKIEKPKEEDDDSQTES